MEYEVRLDATGKLNEIVVKIEVAETTANETLEDYRHDIDQLIEVFGR